MENLLTCLNNFENYVLLTFADEVIRLYKSAILKSTDIIRADPSYNNSPWFSDIAVSMDATDTTSTSNTSNYIIMDQGVCFGKVSS
jgi:hypothetical protein